MSFKILFLWASIVLLTGFGIIFTITFKMTNKLIINFTNFFSLYCQLLKVPTECTSKSIKIWASPPTVCIYGYEQWGKLLLFLSKLSCIKK